MVASILNASLLFPSWEVLVLRTLIKFLSNIKTCEAANKCSLVAEKYILSLRLPATSPLMANATE